MSELDSLYQILPKLNPFECMQSGFMQRAFIGLLLLAPMAAVMGVHVINLRMAFFSDTIGHSAFAGIALGLLLSLDPHFSTVLLGLAIGLAVVAVQRRSSLSTDTVIGVFLSGVVAFGLAVVSRERSLARDLQRFLYGDILTIGTGDILALAGLFIVVTFFQFLAYNRMLFFAVNPLLARIHGVRVRTYQYLHAALLALVVVFSVWSVGVLLVTALMVVPAAAARNFARDAGSMFRWAFLIGLISAVSGLLISAQDWARTATGATVVLVACAFFMLSLIFNGSRHRGNG